MDAHCESNDNADIERPHLEFRLNCDLDSDGNDDNGSVDCSADRVPHTQFDKEIEDLDLDAFLTQMQIFLKVLKRTLF